MKHHASYRTNCLASIKMIGVSVLLVWLCRPAHAASGTWNTATGNNWTNSSNWTASPYPGATSGYANTDTATFGALGGGSINLLGTINVRQIVFGVDGADAGAFTIGTGSDTLNLTTTGVTSIGVNAGVAADEIIDRGIMLSTSNNSTFSFDSNGSGLLIVSGSVTANQSSGSSTTLSLGGVGDGLIGGALRNAGSAGGVGLKVSKYGSGIWLLSGLNTYAGVTTIFGGELVFDYAANDPAGTGTSVVLNGGAVTFEGKASGTTSDTIASLAFTSSAAYAFTANTLTLDASTGSGVNLTLSSLTGPTAGTTANFIDLSSNANNSITVTTLNPAVFTLRANNVLANSTATPYRVQTVVKDSGGYGFATLSSASNGIVGRLATGTSLSSSNSGSTVNFRLATPGTLTRTANLDFNSLSIDSSAGAITLAMGSYNFSSSVARGGILMTGSNTVNITGTGNFGSNGVGIFNYGTGGLTVALDKSSSGTLMFAGTGWTTYSGTTSTTFAITGGIVRFTKAQDFTQLTSTTPIIVSGGGVLEIGTDLNGATGGSFSSTVGNSAGNIRFVGDSGLSGRDGSKTVNFGGASAQITWGANGFLTNADGTTDGGYSLLLSSVKSNTWVDIKNPINLGTDKSRVVNVAHGTSADAILSGVLSGTGATLIKAGAGTLSLAATNTYSGGTIIRAGKLIVTGSLSNTANVSLFGGAELNVNGSINSASQTSVFGTLSGIGAIGSVTVEAAGRFAPGNAGPGTLTTGPAVLHAGTRYALDLKKDASGVAGTTWDKLAVNGTLGMGAVGTGQFTLILQTYAGDTSTFDPNTSHTWASFITTTGGVTGFDAGKFSVDDSAFNWPSGTFHVNQNGTNLDLVYTPSGASIPPGAAELGYTECVIDEAPVSGDIAPGSNGNYKWFNGAHWGTPVSSDHFTTTNGVLTLLQKGDGVTPQLVGTPRDFTHGFLPTLSGENGFYIEFDYRLSDNDPDHFPAVWLMPIEHDVHNGADRYYEDATNYKRYMELDVDEGGYFTNGMLGSVISWTGIWTPQNGYTSNIWNNHTATLDRTQMHTFGASYDPINAKVTWWLDGVKQFSAAYPVASIPPIAARQHFYPILSASTHAAKKPYSMYVSGVRAYVPPSPNPASASLVTGQTFGSQSNGFTGLQGGKIVIGSDDVIVTDLGRMKLSGNTNNHTLKLVDSSTLQDLASGTVPMTNVGTVGQYYYGMLGSPRKLLAGQSYYLLSSETSGGDSWYNGNTTVTTLSSASVTTQASGTTNNTLTEGGQAGHMFGPVNLMYKTSTPLSTVQTWGSTSNSFTGWQGTKFVVGPLNIRITDLGRMMASGNSGTHTVKLVDASSHLDVSGGSVSVNMAGGTAGQFKYASLANPVVLLADHSYYLLSQEVSGGDSSYNGQTVVTTTLAVSVTSQVNGSDNSHLSEGGQAGHGYGPLDFKYIVGTFH